MTEEEAKKVKREYRKKAGESIMSAKKQRISETKDAPETELKRLLAEEGQEAVFEVVDYTNDEMYFPLGIFPTLTSASEYIERAEEKDRAISWHQEQEYEEVVIIKRKFGWTENGSEVLRIKREEYYNEETDEYLWRRVGS